MPVFHRSDVGGGGAKWHDWQKSGDSMRQLEFTGFSRPERANGLNRMGFIRETSRRDDHHLVESSYFGVMSASPEESSAEARKALHSSSADALYTAVRGHTASDQLQTVTAHFTAPARVSPERRDDLIARAEQALSGAAEQAPGFQAKGAIPPPFLHALTNALLTPAAKESRYIFSGSLYRLSIRRSPDPKTAAYFKDRGILRSGAGVVRVSGTVRREAGGKEHEFRLWIEDGAAHPIPLRIDFQPKAYLRLVFEAVA